MTKGTPASAANDGNSSLSFSFTQMAGTNRKLVVACAIAFGEGGVASVNAGDAQLASVAMTLIDTAYFPTYARVYMWEVDNASSGTIDIFFTGNCYAVAGYIEWSDADQAALSATVNNGAGSGNPTITLTGTTAGNTVFNTFAFCYAPAPPRTVDGTKEWDLNAHTGDGGGVGGTVAGGGSVSQTVTAGNSGWCAMGTEVKAIGGGGPPAVKLVYGQRR